MSYPTSLSQLFDGRKRKKKLRLVLDLRHVNKHARKQTFRYEDLNYPNYLVKSTGFSHGTSNPGTTTLTYIFHIGNFWNFLGPLAAINAILYLPCCHSG